MALSENEEYPDSNNSDDWSSYSLSKYGGLAGWYTLYFMLGQLDCFFNAQSVTCKKKNMETMLDQRAAHFWAIAILPKRQDRLLESPAACNSCGQGFHCQYWRMWQVYPVDIGFYGDVVGYGAIW